MEEGNGMGIGHGKGKWFEHQTPVGETQQSSGNTSGSKENGQPKRPIIYDISLAVAVQWYKQMYKAHSDMEGQ
jgi:hypothetical protein